jgi:hypothetical protein
MPKTNLPVRVGASPLAVQDANVTTEISTAGLALGDLISRVGQAVAKTQNKLDTISAESATALATTKAEIVIAQETEYWDNGIAKDVQPDPHVAQLPLITAIDPVFYKWSHVRLQGQFYANEFATASEYHSTNASSQSNNAQSGLLLVIGGGGTVSSSRSTDVDELTSSSSDVSYGRIRLNTLLEPRDDVGIPKPRQVVRGPYLSVIKGEILDVKENDELVGRTMSVLIQYHRLDGTPIEGKSISIETDGVPWSFADPNQKTTDAQGGLELLLYRKFVGENPDTSPADFVVTARIGIISNNTVVTF